jgi:hypothetical protein
MTIKFVPGAKAPLQASGETEAEASGYLEAKTPKFEFVLEGLPLQDSFNVASVRVPAR